MNKGKRFWINNNRGMLRASMALGFIATFILAIVLAGKSEKFGFLAFFVTLTVGVAIILALHMLWGLIIEMADNIATLTDSEIEIPNSEVKIPRPISERTGQTPVQPNNNVERFKVKTPRPISERTARPAKKEYFQDVSWECIYCRQFNDPDCRFCTKCGKPKN